MNELEIQGYHNIHANMNRLRSIYTLKAQSHQIAEIWRNEDQEQQGTKAYRTGDGGKERGEPKSENEHIYCSSSIYAARN